MRVVFFGTPNFAAEILQRLVLLHEVVAVVTRPDTIRKRGKQLSPSPVKEVALQQGIACFDSLHPDEGLYNTLKQFKAEAFCVVAYGALLSEPFLMLPDYGCFNVHASLLPRWRGAAPIERAMLAGDTHTGISIMRMTNGLDDGPYCEQQAIEIQDKYFVDIEDELILVGADLLNSALTACKNNTVEWHEQDPLRVTYASKIKKNEFVLHPEDSSTVNLARVRASNESHPAKAVIGGRTCRIERALLLDKDALPECTSRQSGQVICLKNRLILCCKDGAIEILTLKPEGKRSMEASAYCAGFANKSRASIEWE